MSAAQWVFGTIGGLVVVAALVGFFASFWRPTQKASGSAQGGGTIPGGESDPMDHSGGGDGFHHG